jgi:hypothetical protein
MSWLSHSGSKTVLLQLCDSRGPITHTTLDAISPQAGSRWLRHVLVAHGALPVRDEYLHALERWLHAKLGEVDDPGERRLLSRYVAWTHLRRLRSAATQIRPRQATSIQNEITGVIKLLAWLRNRNTALVECTQADLDQWCLQGGRLPHRARHFIAWCITRKELSGLQIPAPPVRRDRYLLDPDHRWDLAKMLLHSQIHNLLDRVAGLLVLLYGQSAARIVQLTVDHVVATDQQMQLRLGNEPVELPAPFDALVSDLADRADAHGWLFPSGRLAGRPMHPSNLATRLRRIGVSVRDGRNSALIHMASTVPTKVLSDMLGISIYAAGTWSVLAGAGNADYAATVARRTTQAGSAASGPGPCR